MQRLPKRIFIFLSSLNFTILLLALLVLTTLTASIADEIIPLFRSINPSRVTAIRSLLHFFAPTDLHESLWFTTLLIMFSLNLLTCMVRRMPGTLRVLSLFHPGEASTKPSSLHFDNTFTVPSLCQDFEHRLYVLLSRKLSRPAVSGTDATSVFFSQRGRLFHGGFYLAHGGLFMMLAGSVLGSSSSAGEMYLREGESADRLFIKESGAPCSRKLDCALRLDTCEPLPPGAGGTNTPRINYRCTVTMVREGSRDITGVLEGYRTLTGHGMRIGQSRYREEDRHRIILSILSKKAGGKRRTFALRRYQFCTIPETGDTVRLKSIFFPPASSGSSLKVRKPYSAPCMASLEVYGDNGSLIHTPLVSSQAGSSGQPWNEEYEFHLEGVEDTEPASPCMCLTISLEPGAGLIWTGAAVAIAGFSLIFLLSHRKLWVTIARSTGGYSITVAGWASRNPDGLTHYADLIRELAHQYPVS